MFTRNAPMGRTVQGHRELPRPAQALKSVTGGAWRIQEVSDVRSTALSHCLPRRFRTTSDAPEYRGLPLVATLPVGPTFHLDRCCSGFSRLVWREVSGGASGVTEAESCRRQERWYGRGWRSRRRRFAASARSFSLVRSCRSGACGQ